MRCYKERSVNYLTASKCESFINHNRKFTYLIFPLNIFHLKKSLMSVIKQHIQYRDSLDVFHDVQSLFITP